VGCGLWWVGGGEEVGVGGELVGVDHRGGRVTHVSKEGWLLMISKLVVLLMR
jgi:hypothetical protein